MQHHIRNFRQIHEHNGRKIFVSGKPNLRDLDVLREQGVTHIFSGNPNNSHHLRWTEHGGTYHGLDYMFTFSSQDRLKSCVDAADAWKKGKGDLLIHCNEGMGRSPIMAYMVLRRLGVPHEEAMEKAAPKGDERNLPNAQESYRQIVGDMNTLGKAYW